MKRIIYLSLVLVCLHYSASAQVPQTLTYQGFLTDISGNPEQNPVNLVFNIYDGATSVYTATLNSVPVSKGLFTVVLGKNEANNPVIPMSIWTKPLKVGIAVNGGTELPQIELTVVPYAFMAANVDNVHVQDLADGSLTGTKVSPNFGSQNISTTGTITATSFSGSGAALTSLSISSSEIDDGTIVNADINAGAAIADTKLATITTAGKVSNSATTATIANTANTIVLRDASGNFAAGTITATLNGNASTVTTNANLTGDVTSTGNTTSIASGVIVNADINASAGIVDTKLATISTAGKVSNSATTATNTNTANAIVARDASGNFTAGTITATLNGTASTVTTNADLTGDVTSSGNATSIAAGVIVNADINASANIVDTKLATISTAGKVSGNAITSGTIGGSTAVNTSGTIATSSSLVVGNPTASTFTVDIKSGAATSAVVRIDKTAAAGSSMVDFYRAGFIVGNISEASGTVSYNSFTGSHIGLCNESLEIGTLVAMTGELEHIKSNLESEPVYHVVPSQKANDSKILGAYLHPFDKEGLQTDLKGQINAIMAVGNGLMWVADNGQDIEVGDYLISSSVKGHAMKDKGEFDIAYIVGRAAESVRWSEVQDHAGAVKHKRISVFFESFTLDQRAENMETEVVELRDRIGRLENQISQLEKFISVSYPVIKTPKP